MKKIKSFSLIPIITITLLTLFLGSCRNNTTSNEHFIEVVGSAEMEIIPDKIYLIIDIEEYWKEEFEAGKKYKDYKTKVPIIEIEENLFADLKKLGIEKKRIKISEVGNYSRSMGKDFLTGKKFEIVFSDFKDINHTINALNTRGIDRIRLGQMDHKDILEYRKQVKVDALKAAKEKAGYLVGSLDQQLGKVISITEINDRYSSVSAFWRDETQISNSEYKQFDLDYDDSKKIILRYEIQARFEIK